MGAPCSLDSGSISCKHRATSSPFIRHRSACFTTDGELTRSKLLLTALGARPHVAHVLDRNLEEHQGKEGTISAQHLSIRRSIALWRGMRRRAIGKERSRGRRGSKRAGSPPLKAERRSRSISTGTGVSLGLRTPQRHFLHASVGTYHINLPHALNASTKRHML